MIYTVYVDELAATGIEKYARYLAVDRQAPQAASNMLERIWEAIDSLEMFPHRCAIAPESEFSRLEIRMLGVKSVLLLFAIDEQSRQVNVLAFRHGSQEPIKKLGN